MPTKGLFYIGLDLSLSCTGMAAINEEGFLVSTAAIKTKAANTFRGRFDRFDHIARSVTNFVNSHSPAHVLIEGYSFGSRGRGVFNIAESGGITRHALCTQCPQILSIDELAPTSLQKWVTGFGGGTGKAKKVALKKAVEDIYGPLDLPTYDLYDAVGLSLVLWWRSNG